MAAGVVVVVFPFSMLFVSAVGEVEVEAWLCAAAVFGLLFLCILLSRKADFLYNPATSPIYMVTLGRASRIAIHFACVWCAGQVARCSSRIIHVFCSCSLRLCAPLEPHLDAETRLLGHMPMQTSRPPLNASSLQSRHSTVSLPLLSPSAEEDMFEVVGFHRGWRRSGGGCLFGSVVATIKKPKHRSPPSQSMPRKSAMTRLSLTASCHDDQ